MLKKIAIITGLAYLALLTGCASVPMASPELDSKAKSFNVAPGKSNIYIYRNENFGAAMKLAVVVDGKALGQTAAKTYFAVEVEPGKHTVVSMAENTSNLDLVTEVGKNYFVWQEVKMGVLSARSKLQLVDEATGKAAVGECKLIDMSQ